MKRGEESLSIWHYAGYLSLILLLLCGMVFLLASCDRNELSERANGTGELIPVSVHIEGIREESTENITRSSGIGREPVTETIPLGDGMLLEMSLSSDPSSQLRATTPLGSGKRFRVIALKSSDKTYASHGDFTVGVNTTDNNFRVTQGETYDFICVSLNSPDSVPTTTGLLAGSIPAFLTSPTNGINLLYDGTSEKNKTIHTASDAQLSFTLSHKFSQVTLVADCSYNGWIITTAASGTVRLSPCYKVGMDYAGVVTKQGNYTTPFFTWNNITAGTTVTSDARTVFTAGEPISVVISANAFTIDGKSTPSSGQIVASFNGKTLEAGKKYTLTFKIKTPKFAASNLYWDNTTQKLTFAGYSDTPSTVVENKYQGVFFKFGSLIGISPMDYWNQSSTLLYVPPTGAWTSSWYITSANGSLSSLPAGITGTIKNHTTTETVWTGTDYAAIPYASAGLPLSFPRSGHYVTDLPLDSLAEFKGDICKYLDPLYRLPTSYEFTTFENYMYWDDGNYWYGWKRVDGTWTYGSIVSDKEDGTYSGITTGGVFGPTENFFPASGYRTNSGGGMTEGWIGAYWSSSASSTNQNQFGYCLTIDESMAYAGGYWNRPQGHAVRCVLQ
jgi:hypothetical protein